MSTAEMELLESLKQRDRKQWLCAVLLSVLVSGIISFLWHMSVMSELSRLEQLIKTNRCGCERLDAVKQIHQQHVTLSPPWNREDTIREELKRRREEENDDMR